MYASSLMFSKDFRSILGFKSSGPGYWGRPRGPLSPKLKLAILDNIGHVGTLFGAAWVTNHEFDTEKFFGVPPYPQGHPRGSPWVAHNIIFFKQRNPIMWVLYLVLLESQITTLTLKKIFGVPLTPRVTPGGHPGGGVDDMIFWIKETPSCGWSI